jgi:hypothetical protein
MHPRRKFLNKIGVLAVGTLSATALPAARMRNEI